MLLLPILASGNSARPELVEGRAAFMLRQAQDERGTVRISRRWRGLVRALASFGLLGVMLSGCAEEVRQVRTPARELYNQAIIAQEDGLATEAEKQLQTLIDEHPSTRLATLAHLKVGDLNFERRKWEEAEAGYRAFLALNPRSHLTPYVLNRLIAVNYERNAYGIFFPAREYDRNMEPNRTILREYQRFYLLYPQSPYLEEVTDYQRKARADLAEHEFLVGEWYFGQEAYGSAISRYRHLLRNYPEFPRSAAVAQRLIEAYRRNQQPKDAEELEQVVQFLKSRNLLTSSES